MSNRNNIVKSRNISFCLNRFEKKKPPYLFIFFIVLCYLLKLIFFLFFVKIFGFTLSIKINSLFHRIVSTDSCLFERMIEYIFVNRMVRACARDINNFNVIADISTFVTCVYIFCAEHFVNSYFVLLEFESIFFVLSSRRILIPSKVIPFVFCSFWWIVGVCRISNFNYPIQNKCDRIICWHVCIKIHCLA